MVRLFYVFLMVFGWRRSPAAQRHKLRAAATQTALVSRINSVLVLVFLMGFVGKNKKERITPTRSFKFSSGCSKLWHRCENGSSSSVMHYSAVKGAGLVFMEVQ